MEDYNGLRMLTFQNFYEKQSAMIESRWSLYRQDFSKRSAVNQSLLYQMGFFFLPTVHFKLHNNKWLGQDAGFLQMTFDTVIGAIELCDFKVCNEAQNG